MERRSAEMNERLEALRVRSRALKEATRERKIKAQIEERDRQKADEHAAKLTELIQDLPQQGGVADRRQHRGMVAFLAEAVDVAMSLKVTMSCRLLDAKF